MSVVVVFPFPSSFVLSSFCSFVGFSRFDECVNVYVVRLEYGFGKRGGKLDVAIKESKLKSLKAVQQSLIASNRRVGVGVFQDLMQEAMVMR